MFSFYNSKWKNSIVFLVSVVSILLCERANCQSFSQNSIEFNGFTTINNGTGLMYGPDGRLYVTEYTGAVKIYTIERDGPGNYKVVDFEVLTGIADIQDHNDDGTLYESTLRETIGITVVGTQTNPVVYVSSSDFRIGGGGGGDDEGLDTNSGIITRFSWNGTSWDVVDIVRGLPRSEENHATNGLEFTSINGIDYLIVAQGGHTNAGGPSHNFAYTTEYALSAAILSINLTELNSMPVLNDNGRNYIYDIPTLDDPSRPNQNGITDPDDPAYDGVDVNDPFGGNDGLNQAMIVPGGPVQIFSPGYRNAYDLVVTEKGAVYVTDNGANGGWGGFPVNEGGGAATNEYDPSEPGSTSSSDGEQVNNKDHLSLVTNDIENYVFGSFYGGHPTPVRANPDGAGLYTNPSVNSDTEGSIFRSLIYHPTKVDPGYTQDPDIGLPANWPPVPQANPVEGDWRGPEINNPDGPDDEVVLSWGTNTNGIDEYTASNFEGAMKGDLLAGVNNGDIRRVELNTDGSLNNFTPSFFSGLGGNALGVTCNGDAEIFPGTIWVVTLEGNLSVMEPQDFGSCIEPGEPGYDPVADNDFDGYSNQDEEDNQTAPCNGGSQPQDFDKDAGGTLISDLNDPDDDADGILDQDDPFQLGDVTDSGSDAFVLPVINELFSSNGQLNGYLGLGMTGLMNNGDPNPNWLNWLDRKDDPNDPNPNDILGGAIGAMTMQMTAGTAYGNANSQEKGFQYGIQTDQNTGVFTVSGSMFNFDAPLQLYGNSSAPSGELGFFIGDGTQSNYIKFVLTPQGFVGEQEINDISQIQINFDLTNRPATSANFYFVIDPQSGEVKLEYSLDNGTREVLGTIIASGSILNAIQQPNIDLAVGFIGTSNASGVEVEGTWDYLNVTFSTPVIAAELPDLNRNVGDNDDNINLDDYFLDDKGTENLTYSVEGNTNNSISATITGNTLNLNYPLNEAEATITIRATDEDNNFVEDSFTVFLTEQPLVLHRINCGGPAVTSIDGDIDWDEDTADNPSQYLSEAGTGSIFSGNIVNYTSAVDQQTTPVNVFDTERYDGASGLPNLTYSLPVSETGYYEVRLYMGNGWDGTSATGSRIFDVSIEDFIYTELDDIDLSDTYGHQTGTMISQVVNITDGVIDISFIHGIQNPLINAIEILNYTGPVDTPIQVSSIPDQINSLGEELDGSLVVSASGGDGNLSYSMVGAPPGVVIEPTNGQIGGTIDTNADITDYTVTISVDDNDENQDDIVSTAFTWTILGNTPVLEKEFPDLDRIVGDSGDEIDLNEYFLDDQGVQNLTYTIESNTDASINTSIVGSILSLSYPSFPAESIITIRATDEDSNFVEDTFTVFLTDPLVLYRVNTGGPAIASLDEEIDWEEDSASSVSAYLSEPGNGAIYSGNVNSYTSDVDQDSTPLSIFQTERYDGNSGPPDLTYSFPVSASGNYEVRLYMGNGYDGTAQTGSRIFDVSINGVVYSDLNNLDLSDTYGHQTGTMISQVINVTGGVIDISFIHGVENPLINGIEILKFISDNSPIIVETPANQTSYLGQDMDGGIFVSASGGDGPLNFTMVGAPPGISLDPLTGIMEGSIANSADVSNPYSVTVTVDDNDEDFNDTESISFNWTVTEDPPTLWSIRDEDKNYTARHECSFVQAGDKFYLIGGRENAQTLDIYDYNSNSWVSLVDSAPQEFNHYQATEYEGLIWVIGAFQTNSFPNETPAEFIWAFDPAAEEWIQVAEIPENRRRGSAGLTVYNDKFYISGGNTIGHNGGYVSWFDEFDPATGTWTSLPDAPRPRDHFHAAVIDDKLYLAGGRLSGGSGGTFKPVISEVDVYDFLTNTWSTLPADQNLPTPRAAAVTVNFNGKLVVAGGEVEDEVVYGELTSDALKITEQYDPVTGIWNRLEDLNFERHGTQGIVSGDGIFVLSGSPNKGGGSQKNMEYYGNDNPVGVPSLASNLSAPNSISISVGSTGDINLEVIDGNVGIIVTSMVITGPNSENFQINAGNLNSALIKPNNSHSITIEHLGSETGETATLLINYGLNNVLEIQLESNSTNPVVNITNPTNNQNFSSPADIQINAEASDPNGNVTQVEFFEGTNSLGIDTDAGDGWGITWTNVQSGTYELTAVATDNNGDTTTSSSININVDNALPVVAITSPDDNATFTAPADISITAEASDADGTITQVEFFEGTTSLGIDTDAGDGWSINWTNVQSGTYELTAVAIDNDGATTTSSTININIDNALPVVAITSPEDNASFTAPTDISITADASDADGTITQVEFFEGTNSLGIDTEAGDGWGITWTDVQSGTYELTAVATDNDGATTTSSIINFSVDNALPVVAITSPEDNTSFTAPADISITAEASDADGTITQVEFFEGTNSLGIDTDAGDGWGITWTDVDSGIYELTAVATDNDGATTTSTIINVSVDNALPVVAITSPEDNASFTAPADISITAEASDADGTITQIEFFEGTTSLGIDTDAGDGWGITWTNVQSGTYELTAVATDNDGATTTSSIINISVDNALPVVAITSPEDNASFTAPAEISITAEASDADGTITQVEFFEGTTSLGIDTDAGDGWSINWTNVQSGTYELTAVATDNDGATTTSSSININVDNALPVVAITSPEDNASFTAPAEISITAEASDADGTITQVEFFEGTNSLGIDTDAGDGWGITWTNVESGTYELTAVATDNNGDTTTSSSININVDNALPVVAITSPDDNASFTAPAEISITAEASDADGTITQVEFFEGTTSLGIDTDASDGWGITWTNVQSGTYELTAVATDNDGATTTSSSININVDNALPVVAITSPEDNASFTAPAEISITAEASDADGTITQVEFFEGTTSLGIDTDASDGWGITWTNVQSGTYELTAVATDNDGATTTSSSININVDNALPVVAITSPEDNASFTAPAEISITAEASDADGTITQVEFFEGTNSLGIDTDAGDGWGITWTNVQSGTYELTAVATDNDGDTTTSAVININVDNALPVVAITSPEDNASFTAPAEISITAEASDADGTITQVEFFEGTTSLGIDTDAGDGWSINWTNVQSGTYELTAVATDNDGATTTSSIININVDNALPVVAITSPEDNASFTAPAEISITAEASDADGTITQVEFFEGTTSLGIDTDANDGWGITWTNVQSGTYELTAVATDNDGATTTSSIININVDNALPVVAITSPEDNASFTAPAEISITADASDADGTITEVEFFEGTNSLGIDTDASDGWSINWTDVGSGTYELTAVATDNDGDTTISAMIIIEVTDPVGNISPTVSITSPDDNASFTATAEISITADASDADGTITEVEFFEGTNSLGIDTDASDGWSINWTDVGSGTYELTAVATDNDGDTTISAMIIIEVTDPVGNISPTVSITSPDENASFTAPAEISITADASDADGTITQVEFFEGTNSLGIDTDASDGWGITWTDVQSGTYELTAVATDNDGDTTISAIINIEVTDPVGNISPTVSITSPEDNASFTAPAEISISADASDADGTITQVEFFAGANSLGIDTDASDGWGITWTDVESGTYELTALATDNNGDTTTSAMINIEVTDPVGNISPTVSITSPEDNASFTAPAVISINAEAGDLDGTVISVEFFEGANSLGIDTDASDGWGITWTDVESGTYELTALATDNDGDTTTSAIINIEVTDPVGNISPTVSITSPEDNASFTAPAEISINAEAGDVDGTVISVEFFEGANSLGIDTDASDGWGITWTDVESGTYELTAVATDNDGDTTTSAIINIEVTDPFGNISPTVSITSPEDNASFTAPAVISINAEAGDVDGTVISVEFFEGANSLGIDTDAGDGWGITWTDVESGTYELTALATDNNGDTTISAIINIEVTDPVGNVSPTVSITSPEDNASFTAPAEISITADASDADGTITEVEFFEGTNFLGIDTDAGDGWGITWTDVGSGTYELTAVATDNDGDTTISGILNIEVTDPVGNISPTVSITSPEDTASFTATAEISITADASDADGTITQVEFFEGANSVGIDTDASDGWGITWTDVESGTYELTAVATDNEGDTTISALIFITILTQETINVPEDLAAEWISNNEIYVTWIDNNTEESEFILERSTNMDFSGQVTIINLPGNTTTYNDRNLFNLSGSKVYYRIKAVKGNLISAYSNIALAEVYGGAISIPRDENDKEITDESLMVYPNPSIGESTIRFNLMEDSEYSLDLYDAKGAYLFRITSGRVRAAVEYVYNLEIQHLPNGMYLVILNSSTGSQNFNLILRR